MSSAEQRLVEYDSDKAEAIYLDDTNQLVSVEMGKRCAVRGYHLAKLSDSGCACGAALPPLAPPSELVVRRMRMDCAKTERPAA